MADGDKETNDSKRLAISEFKKAIENISGIAKNLDGFRVSIKELSDLVKEEIVDGAHKREDELLESLGRERDTNEKFASTVGNLAANFKTYDETLNKFLETYNFLLEDYRTKLDDAISKVREGTDKFYTILNNCVELVEKLNVDFGFVKDSNAKALGRIEELLKGNLDEQVKWLEIQTQQTGLLKKVSYTHDELLKNSSLINSSLDRRMAEAERTVGRIQEAAANIERFGNEIPEKLDNTLKDLSKALFDSQQQSLDSITKKVNTIADGQAELQFLQKDEFTKAIEEYKKIMGKRRGFNAKVEISAVVLAAGLFGYYYFNSGKPVYSNVSLENIKCEQPVYIEGTKNTTYCNQDDKEGIIFIDDSDSNGKADYIVVKKNRGGSIAYYGMDLKSIDARNNPNQFVKADRILAEQKTAFNSRLKPDENYFSKIKKFVEDRLGR